MTKDEQVRANAIAIDVALTELVKLLLGEMCKDHDPKVFRTRIKALEAAAVNSITNFRSFPQAKDEDSNYIKEAASGFITRLLSSIRHPND